MAWFPVSLKLRMTHNYLRYSIVFRTWLNGASKQSLIRFSCCELHSPSDLVSLDLNLFQWTLKMWNSSQKSLTKSAGKLMEQGRANHSIADWELWLYNLPGTWCWLMAKMKFTCWTVTMQSTRFLISYSLSGKIQRDLYQTHWWMGSVTSPVLVWCNTNFSFFYFDAGDDHRQSEWQTCATIPHLWHNQIWGELEYLWI